VGGRAGLTQAPSKPRVLAIGRPNATTCLTHTLNAALGRVRCTQKVEKSER